MTAIAAEPATPQAAPQPVVPAAPAAAPSIPAFGQPSAEPGPSANQLIDAFHASRGKAGAQGFAGSSAEQAAAIAPPSGAAPPAPAPVAAAAAGAPPAVDPNAPVAGAAPAVDPAAGTDPNAAPALDGEDQPQTFLARLPGRNPGDPDMEVELDDPVLFDRINQLRNAAMRGEDARRVRDAGQRAIQEGQELADHIQTDPVGFIGQYLPPEQQAEIALGTLLNPAIWGELKPVLTALLASDDAARTARSEFEVRRLQMKEQARLTGEERRQAGQNAAVLTQGIERITPNLPPEQIGIFQNDMRSYLREYVNQNGLKFVAPEHLAAILAPRLTAWGINPAAAAQRLFSQPEQYQHPSQHPAQPRNGGVPPRAPAPAPAAPAAPGQQFLRSAQAKAGLAAGAPPGAGASALAIPTVPKKMSIKQAANWLREQAGVQRPQ